MGRNLNRRAFSSPGGGFGGGMSGGAMGHMGTGMGISILYLQFVKFILVLSYTGSFEYGLIISNTTIPPPYCI